MNQASERHYEGLPYSSYEVVYTEAEIQARIQALADQISSDYAHKELVLVSMLKGSVHFLSDLSRKIEIPHLFDVIAIKPRDERMPHAPLELAKDITIDVCGKDVLMLEEVVRTGYTTQFMYEHLKSKAPKSLKLAAFLSNPKQMLVDLPLRYVGFEVNFDRYVGYGLDHQEHGRSLPFIAKHKP